MNENVVRMESGLQAGQARRAEARTPGPRVPESGLQAVRSVMAQFSLEPLVRGARWRRWAGASVALSGMVLIALGPTSAPVAGYSDRQDAVSPQIAADHIEAATALPLTLTSTPPPTPGERLVPTAPPASRTPVAGQTQEAPTTPVAASPAVAPGLWTPRQRFGVGVPYPPIGKYDVARLGIGWYYAWRVVEETAASSGIETWQMVRVSMDGFRPDAGTITNVAQTHPGSTWLIGNEPDVIGQDNVTPVRYAQLYHDAYLLLKQADPGCQVVAGGITQPTPLRLQYLDAVLQAYQDAFGERMPVDMWHMHNYILREERGSWGVGIPPGIGADSGVLYEVEDNDNMVAFERQVVAFRRWMVERGERDQPLIVSEYGILMPEDYGFGFERVRDFLYATFDFFLATTDSALGCPADGNRLVQRWAWFSMGDPMYPTGDLADLEGGQLTRLGEAFGDYVERLEQ